MAVRWFRSSTSSRSASFPKRFNAGTNGSADIIDGRVTKTVGIIGGIAPESTIAYYRQIIERHRQVTGGGNPSIIINSNDLTKMLGLVGSKDFETLIDYLSGEMNRLADAGADFAVFASNTPHIVFNEVASRSKIPLISIVESASRVAEKLGVKKAGLLGTRFTMQGRFYPEVFAARGIEVVAPESQDLDYVHDKYMTELVNARFLDETRRELLRVIERMRERQHIDTVILGGTELPLILSRELFATEQLLDTTEIHVRAIVDALTS
jgi:aspartate racemase